MKTIFSLVTRFLVWVALALYGLGLVDFLLHPLARDFTFHSILFRVVSILLLTPITLMVGFLIMQRVPGNIVGPLLVVWSGTLTFGSLRMEIGSLPFSLFSYYDIALAWFALTFMIYHFPDGNIFPPRAAPWMYSQSLLAFIVTSLLFLGTASRYNVPNAFFVPALERFVPLLLPLGMLLVTIALVMILVSLVFRYHKSGFLVRQQIKWLAFFGIVETIATLLGSIIYPLMTGSAMLNRENNLFTLLFSIFTGLFPPVAIGVAILRHHLWDIDLLIRRSLVYSILTISLTLVYFGSVVFLQAIFQLFAQQNQPPVVTVISTLTAAFLFTPFRQRIQTFIDRRFYRKKYNADQVLANFSASLRENVDVEHVEVLVLGTVEDSLQPANSSLWLCKSELPPTERDTSRPVLAG